MADNNLMDILLPYMQSIEILGDNGEFVEVLAKFDSGADNCSLDETTAQKLGLNKNFIAEADIINANGTDKRPIIEIMLKLKDNDIKIKTLATLADRSELDSVLLIGRNALQPTQDLRFLINPKSAALKKTANMLKNIAKKLQGDVTDD